MSQSVKRGQTPFHEAATGDSRDAACRHKVVAVVSAKYLQTYLDEYAWRYNHRHDGGMLDALLARATRAE
jgi:hypothetical protein